MQWQAVIGLEVHAQLSTASKIFCGCSTAQAAEPNTHVCPVCLGMPGTLPVLNRRVGEDAARAGLALGCAVQARSVLARKNYFYPDLPKGYQISQYELPICVGGSVSIQVDGTHKVIRLNRIHMEEDAGKTIHGQGADAASYLDYNRTGIPLLEIVTEPDLRSAAEAAAYLKSLHQTLQYLGICEGNMELGQFRCDANVSVRPMGQEKLGTKAELKNMNSFRNVEKAIEYEIGRQIAIVNQGGTIVQETRLWDAGTGKSRPMRGKEEAHDYRYFPDPDLQPVVLSSETLETVRNSMPELPADRRQRYVSQLGLPLADAQTITDDRAVADYFEATLAHYPDARKAANWITGEVLHALKEGQSIGALPVTANHLAQLLRRIDDGTISGKIAKDVFAAMMASGQTPDTVIDERGLRQNSNSGELDAAVQSVVAANPKECERFRAGETKLMGFFVGQVMKATGGKANPAMVNELLRRYLNP